MEQAYAHLRIDTFGSPQESDDDLWLSEIGIPGARQWCEQYLGLSVAQQTIELATNSFPGSWFELPFGPVESIVSVTYVDENGADQTMPPGDYEVDQFSEPPRLILAYGAEWPAARNSTNSVRVRYVTGFSLPGDSPQSHSLPPAIRSAMLLVLGHFYENREDATTSAVTSIPLGAQALLDLNRVRLGMA